MEQLIEAFGIDVKLITVQIINFVLLLGVLSYFLYTPILKLLREREEKIRQGLEDATESARLRQAADDEKRGIVAEAHKEAEAVAQRAKSFAEEKTKELVHKAEKKAETIISSAQVHGVALKVQAQKESEAEIAKLAVLAAEKILQERN